MARVICSICERPEKVCLCQYVTAVPNQIKIGILQHPTEARQIKGTAKIAQLSLSQCDTWIGEHLDDLPGLVDWLMDGEAIFLLYPKIEGQIETFKVFHSESVKSNYSLDRVKVLVLDGTWRKTHKIMMLNERLRSLNRITIIPNQCSSYRIRKQKNTLSLSTIEAIYEVLAGLEPAGDSAFKRLLTSFEAMQAQQLRFRRPLK